MITPKIKSLFQFIEYLHSNINNFNQHDKVINKLHQLYKQLYQLSDENNYKEKLMHDKLLAEITDNLKIIKESIIIPIQTKATELSICDTKNHNTIWNWNIDEIQQLKKNFTNEDLPEIFYYKSKYKEYREKTNNEGFFLLLVFFNELDLLLKQLFNYFKETDYNEFEAFKTKAIQVNDIGEVFKLLEPGTFQKFTLPNKFLNTSPIQQQTNIEPLPPQPIVNKKTKLKINQIALKYVYEGLQITRENGNEIAKEYGHNSGEKLFQRFTYFSSSANRKGKPNLCTPKKLEN